MTEARKKASPGIEAEILRRIREHPKEERIVILHGDIRWLLDRLDELEAYYVPCQTIEDLKQDLTKSREREKRLIRDIAMLKSAAPHFDVSPTVDEYVNRIREQLDKEK